MPILNRFSVFILVVGIALCVFSPGARAGGGHINGVATGAVQTAPPPKGGMNSNGIQALNCPNNPPLCAATDCACIEQELRCAQLKQAQSKKDVVDGLHAQSPRIILDTYECLTKIDDLLKKTQVPNIASLAIDPLIDAFIGQVCNVALDTINQVNAFTLSQANRLCLPSLPGLAITPPDLGLIPASCNGTPLLEYSPMPSQGPGPGSGGESTASPNQNLFRP